MAVVFGGEFVKRFVDHGAMVVIDALAVVLAAGDPPAAMFAVERPRAA